jgi:hypothetical protein
MTNRHIDIYAMKRVASCALSKLAGILAFRRKIKEGGAPIPAQNTMEAVEYAAGKHLYTVGER